ncbi:hypothetical protein CTEN210_10030 [Chaetoceros tenuissimus]|uniref:C2H2-type domain-containing protein n=1 Tax=Chaetoceros tenuissimus TaxID=426638 RepID=A0AAD3H880_9STRA|nr:hypothetical protein CTEN210_10030 [Chaetoceros tenuissimus]
MEEVPVESGLWTMFSANYPVGIAVRNHPIDRTDIKLNPRQLYLPMEKIYCDRKVTARDGTIFYRIQAHINAWVFDRRGDYKMLLPESSVKIGLFAYKAVSTLAIRNEPSMEEESKTTDIVRDGDIVVADAVQVADLSSSGPFLRLVDGRGWLFEYKNGDRVMEEIPVFSGKWRFRILNSVGLAIRKFPADREDNHSTLFLAQGEECECDRKIEGLNGVSYYRVKGSCGWLFDMRGGDHILHDITPSNYHNESAVKNPWSPDFVRGIAEAIEDLYEIQFNEASRVISFRNSAGVRFNIYYTTRTVGTSMIHPMQGSTQLFRRNCTNSELVEIFRNPRFHSGKGYQRRSNMTKRMKSEADSEADGEADLRTSLLEVREEINRLTSKEDGLLKAIRTHSIKRFSYAIAAEERRIVEETRRTKEISHQCSACGKEFKTEQARNQHYQASHEFTCWCGKVCYSEYSLDQHKDAKGHW